MSMDKKENIFNFDSELIVFIVLNILFVDSSLLLVPIIMIILAIVVYSENITIPYMIFSIIGLLVLLLITFLKLFILIIYYNTLYKRVKNPLVIKFIEALKSNKNNIRVKFTGLVLLPYIILIIFNTRQFYNSPLELVSEIIFTVSISSTIPYLIFYKYLDECSK